MANEVPAPFFRAHPRGRMHPLPPPIAAPPPPPAAGVEERSHRHKVRGSLFPVRLASLLQHWRLCGHPGSLLASSPRSPSRSRAWSCLWPACPAPRAWSRAAACPCLPPAPRAPRTIVGRLRSPPGPQGARAWWARRAQSRRSRPWQGCRQHERGQARACQARENAAAPRCAQSTWRAISAGLPMVSPTSLGGHGA